jgi:HD superfamily phosphohydrolase
MSRSIEIRDPVYAFVRLAGSERRIIDSRPFQRLRDIHQLALTYLVYPGATHRRFEHSLGVMELASRIFDVVTDPTNLHEPSAREIVPPDADERGYWRRVLRAAALFHDVGHLPFSHAAEGLLPDGWDHEELSRAHILSDEMRGVWQQTIPPVIAEHVAAVAVKPRKGETVPPWIAILRDIITSNVFGADRMDYLLRDSHHIGVAYGRFDHHRLVDTIRILRPPPQGEAEVAQREESTSPELGVTVGGLHAAEALLLARYAMRSQVYFHRTRRVYDLHLADFLTSWLKNGQFSTRLRDHLAMSDARVLNAVYTAARSSAESKRDLRTLARRITHRDRRFALLYERKAGDVHLNADGAEIIANAGASKFGAAVVRFDAGGEDSEPGTFPVRERDGSIVASGDASELVSKIPASRYEFVFVDPDRLEDARSWLDAEKANLMETSLEPETADD